MSIDLLADWVRAHWLPIVGGLAVTVVLLTRRRYPARKESERRRPPAAVVVAALAAVACTAYSADTSWRFAAHHLDMTSTAERAAMFAAAELALFATALMARQNLRTTGAPGVPGLLVWVITGVQVIPAYAESGVVGGTVRAFVGPVLAALLWHLAMGIELRHAKPGTNSQSLPSILARELRERLLSRLGLATRNRSAEQISRDRATARAVRLAARPKLRAWGRRRLAAAVAGSGVGIDAGQRNQMLQLLAARRGALSLSTIDLLSPFEAEPQSGTAPEPNPARVVLVPVPARDRGQVPAGAEARPELQAVPEPTAEAEVKPAPEPARRTSRRNTRKNTKDAALKKHVASARRWLATDPELSGSAIGKKLGKSDRYGRMVKNAALEQAS